VTRSTPISVTVQSIMAAYIWSNAAQLFEKSHLNRFAIGE